MVALAVPDTLADVRWYLRNQPDLNAIHSGNVFYRIPKSPVFPLMRMYRIGAGLAQDIPVSTVVVAVECWFGAPTEDVAGAGYDTVRLLAQTLESVLFRLPAGTLLNPAGLTVAQSALVTAVNDSPDPESGWPRIVCDTRWIVTTATP